MKIGLIVDGVAEVQSLPKLYSRLNTPHHIVKTLKADIQPFAPLPQTASRVRAQVPILTAKGVELIIILADSEENNPLCPVQWAQQLTALLNKPLGSKAGYRFAVVVKNSCYENWLISDSALFSRMPKRFQLNASHLRSIVPNKADQLDAQAILEAAVQGGEYNKVKDAIAIMTHADPLAMAANSRSFRRLLRAIESPAYIGQSRVPTP